MSKAMVRETGRTGVMRAVTDLLDAEHILYFRMNAGDRLGSYTSKRTGKTSRWRIKGHAKGTADLLLFIGTRPVWCECKRPGEPLTAEQCEFAGMVQGTYNHVFIIVEDPAELQAWLKDQKKAA
jgi:hypothetical protein